MKKIIISVIMIILSVGMTAMANEYTAEVADMAEYFGEELDWHIDDEVKYEKDKITLSEAGITTNINNKYKNEVFGVDISNDFGEKNAGWLGVMLRAQKVDSIPWSTDPNDCYLFIIKKNQIELQRFSNRVGKYLACVKNPVEDFTDVEMKVGTVDVEGGTLVFLTLDGETVINTVDTTPLSNEGYLSFYSASSQTTIKPLSDEISGLIPINIKAENKTNFYNPTYSYDTFVYGTATEANFSAQWQETEIDLVELKTVTSPKEYEAKIVCDGDACTVGVESDGKYLNVVLKDEKSSFMSNSIPINIADALVKNGVYMIDNFYITRVNGKQEIVDEDTILVSPVRYGEDIFVPIRFIADSMGWDLVWNNDINAASLIVSDKVFEIYPYIGRVTVNGTEYENTASDNHGRAMISLKLLKKWIDCDIYYDTVNEVIAINTNNEYINNKVLADLAKLIRTCDE